MRGLMLHLDPARAGWCIDAGIGWFDFYFEWMHKLGYRTIAIEPALSPEVVQLCQRLGSQPPNIWCYDAALGDRDGVANLYHNQKRDIRSLSTMWGGMEFAQMVQMVSLPSIIKDNHLEQVTALKLDIEGTEPDVIATLPELDPKQLPLIISFEWGGEQPMRAGTGAWSQEQQHRVRTSFDTLVQLGYRTGLIIGDGDGVVLRLIEGGSIEPFEDDDQWGNAILTRGNVGMAELVEYAQTTVSDE